MHGQNPTIDSPSLAFLSEENAALATHLRELLDEHRLLGSTARVSELERAAQAAEKR
jgi:hypothetical protein